MSQLDETANDILGFLDDGSEIQDETDNVMDNNPPLLKLSKSVLKSIFMYLDYKDIISLRSCCHVLYDFSFNDDIWSTLYVFYFFVIFFRCDVYFGNLFGSSLRESKLSPAVDRRYIWYHTFVSLYSEKTHLQTALQLNHDSTHVPETIPIHHRKSRVLKVVNNTKSIDEIAADAARDMDIMRAALKLQTELSGGSSVDNLSIRPDRFSKLYSGQLSMHRAVKTIAKEDMKKKIQQQKEQAKNDPTDSTIATETSKSDKNSSTVFRSPLHSSPTDFVKSTEDLHRMLLRSSTTTPPSSLHIGEVPSNSNVAAVANGSLGASPTTPYKIVNLSDINDPLDSLLTSNQGQCSKMRRTQQHVRQKQVMHDHPSHADTSLHSPPPINNPPNSTAPPTLHNVPSSPHRALMTTEQHIMQAAQGLRGANIVSSRVSQNLGELGTILAIVREWRRRRNFLETEADESVDYLMSLSRLGANGHMCFGNKCRLDRVAGVLLCRDSGTWHVCGHRCDRVIGDSSDGLLVCPTSGQCFDEIPQELDLTDAEVLNKYCTAMAADEERRKEAGIINTEVSGLPPSCPKSMSPSSKAKYLKQDENEGDAEEDEDEIILGLVDASKRRKVMLRDDVRMAQLAAMQAETETREVEGETHEVGWLRAVYEEGYEMEDEGVMVKKDDEDEED